MNMFAFINKYKLGTCIYYYMHNHIFFNRLIHLTALIKTKVITRIYFHAKAQRIYHYLETLVRLTLRHKCLVQS